MPVGVMVTLRQNNMYEFMDRLVNVALPRVKDFKGISPESLLMKKETTLWEFANILFFQKSKLIKLSRFLVMNITFVTKAKNKEQAFELLTGLGMPFREK